MDEKLIESFNKQLNQEFHSAYLYFAMSTYFAEIAMFGFSNFMKHKASEKLNCAQKIYDYIILRDEKLTFLKIEEPQVDWINVSDIFSSALTHEEFMLEQTKKLYITAQNVQDIGAMEFIGEVINEQIKIIGCFKKISFRIKNSNAVSANIDIFDEQINKLNF